MHKSNHIGQVLWFVMLLCYGTLHGSTSLAADEQTTSQGKPARYLTVHGQVDPRLKVSLLSWFRSSYQHPDCTRRDWNTGSAKNTLTVDGETGLTNEFTVKIPIDYVRDGNKCRFEFANTKLQLSRLADNRYKNYSRYTLLSSSNKGSHVEKGYEGGQSRSKDFPGAPITDKQHYFLGANLRFECRTRKYIGTGNVEFYCLPQSVDWYQGVNELRDMTINLEVVVDESERPFLEYQRTLGDWWHTFYYWLF